MICFAGRYRCVKENALHAPRNLSQQSFRILVANAVIFVFSSFVTGSISAVFTKCTLTDKQGVFKTKVLHQDIIRCAV